MKEAILKVQKLQADPWLLDPNTFIVLMHAMELVILLSKAENGPKPWINRAREIVEEFEK